MPVAQERGIPQPAFNDCADSMEYVAPRYLLWMRWPMRPRDKERAARPLKTEVPFLQLLVILPLVILGEKGNKSSEWLTLKNKFSLGRLSSLSSEVPGDTV